MPLDKLRQTGALSNWFPLPWGGPDIVILPGFHTAAEVGLKKSGGAAGNDMFLAIMGLMSTGSRTILISRWRTGGQTCHDLIRQFAQELPYETAATAWQRSVKSALDQPITPGLEPRVKDSTNVTPPKAEHPFLWSGYLLVDNGTPPQKQEVAPAAPPVLKFDPRLVKPGNPAAAPGAAPANPEKAEKLPEKADKPDEKAEKPDEKEKAGA